MVISYDQALKIVEKFSQEIASKFGDVIIAVFAIGSLGSDYYRPGQSDIDTAIISSCTRDDLPAVKKEIAVIQDKYWRAFDVPKGFGAIVFAEEQLYPPYVKEEELILEILRLKMQSKLIYGHYDVGIIPTPPKRAIIDDAIAFQTWADNEKKKDPDFRVDNEQKFVNSTLIALKRYLMIRHGMIEFNKFKVIDLYLQNEPPLINDEAFELINASLHGTSVWENDEKIARMIQWYDVLYEVINREVLYSE